MTRAVDAHPERLPQIAHFNIFVLAHKNADEPETVCRPVAAVQLSVIENVIPP